MARRKIALILILVGMMVLILSPWKETSRPQTVPAVAIPQAEPAIVSEPAELAMPARLSVAVAMEEEAFQMLAEQNVEFRKRHRDITVALTRVEPDNAYRYFQRASEMEEAADVMLLSSDWVSEFAASGYLLPVEAAFVGKAEAEQFDALIAPVKWNDYKWGVPLDFDPYVLVWNETLLEQWLGNGVSLPLTIEQWGAVATKSAETFGNPVIAAGQQDADASQPASGPISWLSIDPNDPYALLSWLENAAGTRTDTLWTDGGESWAASPLGNALELVDAYRAGMRFASSAATVRDQMYGGDTLVAAVPYSVAMELMDNGNPSVKLKLDHSSWRLPYVWPRGTSYVMSSGTAVEEAAMTWISEMTDASIQSANEKRLNRLPVYRSIYDGDTGSLSNLLPSRGGQSFPNQASSMDGPELAGRLLKLKSLWQQFASSQLSIEEWKQNWS
ncbi:extracellular solute-binding protein [Cohnella panacarvi]|uniref:extracellular solute-binding protein n=1 Tax=Cohnella panacarvi TaxID=400776 RepID=UPI0004793CAF|nr:extracellular solute-binding protein [Cohnella panacarvi]